MSYEAKLKNPSLISYLGRNVSIKHRPKHVSRSGDVVAPLKADSHLEPAPKEPAHLPGSREPAHKLVR